MTQTMPRAPQVTSIKATSEEVLQGALTKSKLLEAREAIIRDGLVVIENAVDHASLDHLNTKMVADAKILRDLGKDTPFNYNRGNLQQDAPPIRKYFDKKIFLNPLATQVTSAVMGSKPKLTFCSGNTAMPPSAEVQGQRQPVHSDADFDHPARPFALVVNVPLVTMTPENGSTEVWLGTHEGFGLRAQEGAHGDRASGRIQEALLAERRQINPPIQPVVPKGSIIVRDLRLWHAGMPNNSTDIRVMLAMIHFAPWFDNKMRMEFGEGVKEIIDAEEALDVRANFVSEAEAERKYLRRGFGNSYDFSEGPTLAA